VGEDKTSDEEDGAKPILQENRLGEEITCPTGKKSGLGNDSQASIYLFPVECFSAASLNPGRDASITFLSTA
jgi:hypothetical protein